MLQGNWLYIQRVGRITESPNFLCWGTLQTSILQFRTEQRAFTVKFTTTLLHLPSKSATATNYHRQNGVTVIQRIWCTKHWSHLQQPISVPAVCTSSNQQNAKLTSDANIFVNVNVIYIYTTQYHQSGTRVTFLGPDPTRPADGFWMSDPWPIWPDLGKIQ